MDIFFFSFYTKFRHLWSILVCFLSQNSPEQGVTKRCRLSWLTNSALVYEPKRGGRGGESCESCGVSANEYSCAHGAQINFRDLTPYLTYGLEEVAEKLYLCNFFSVCTVDNCLHGAGGERAGGPQVCRDQGQGHLHGLPGQLRPCIIYLS
jgi:hypothetical protein